MAIVIKTIKNHQYRYYQHSYREGRKVKTRAIYLGPIGNIDWNAVFRRPRGVITPAMEQEMLAQVQAAEARDAAQQKAIEEKLGVTFQQGDPKPIEKPIPAVSSLITPVSSQADTSVPAPPEPSASEGSSSTTASP